MSQIVSLWKRARAAAAFEQCVRGHVPRLFNLAWRLTRSTTDAEDLVQETLLRAYSRREQLLELQAPGAWLARVLHNAWIDRWRRKGVMRDADSLDAEEAGDASMRADSDQALMNAVDAAAIMRAVAQLPEGQQLVVLLHDAAGYTLEEIAEALGIAVGTSKSRLHRARQALRERLTDGTFSGRAACIPDRRS